MIKQETKPIRKSTLRMVGYDYSLEGAYFVTIVTKDRVCLLGDIEDGKMIPNRLGEITQVSWLGIKDHFPFTKLGEFIIMPNHIHGIIDISVRVTHASPQLDIPARRGPKPGSLGVIIGSFKSAVSKQARIELKLSNIWQRNYHDHIIRNQADLERTSLYIRSNPQRWVDDEENLNKKATNIISTNSKGNLSR